MSSLGFAGDERRENREPCVVEGTACGSFLYGEVVGTWMVRKTAVSQIPMFSAMLVRGTVGGISTFILSFLVDIRRGALLSDLDPSADGISGFTADHIFLILLWNTAVRSVT